MNNVDRYVIKFVNYLKSNKHCDVYLLERAFGGATINKLYNEFAQDAGYFSEKPKRLIFCSIVIALKETLFLKREINFLVKILKI